VMGGNNPLNKAKQGLVMGFALIYFETLGKKRLASRT
jgi:hypothetical protein